jgi:hypothetical protein
LQSRIVVVCIQNKENGANDFFAWPWHLNPIAWPETHYYSLLSPLQIPGSKESKSSTTMCGASHTAGRRPSSASSESPARLEADNGGRRRPGHIAVVDKL